MTEIDGGSIWWKNIFIHQYICPHCEKTHHEFVEDLTPFVPWHPENIRKADIVTGISHSIVCFECSGWLKAIIRFLKKWVRAES